MEEESEKACVREREKEESLRVYPTKPCMSNCNVIIVNVIFI